MRKLLFLPFGLVALPCLGQDSLTADYNNTIVQKIESHLQLLVMEKTDTTFYDTPDSTAPLQVHTEYYFNMQTEHIEKIYERSSYGVFTTEITVYYQLGQPIKFTSTQWEKKIIKADFDVYFSNSHFVYFTKRTDQKGKPDGDEFLKWSYQLLRSYRRTEFVMED
jgi:hypothetical protein